VDRLAAAGRALRIAVDDVTGSVREIGSAAPTSFDVAARSCPTRGAMSACAGSSPRAAATRSPARPCAFGSPRRTSTSRAWPASPRAWAPRAAAICAWTLFDATRRARSAWRARSTEPSSAR
jgi:hypothetical protein